MWRELILLELINLMISIDINLITISIHTNLDQPIRTRFGKIRKPLQVHEHFTNHKVKTKNEKLKIVLRNTNIRFDTNIRSKCSKASCYSSRVTTNTDEPVSFVDDRVNYFY